MPGVILETEFACVIVLFDGSRGVVGVAIADKSEFKRVAISRGVQAETSPRLCSGGVAVDASV